MIIKKNIPNLLTLGNLLSGTIGAIYAVQGELQTAALFVLAGILFDFLDGFVARLLKVTGELGKQLDSLADMVTSGVVPGIVMYQLIINSGVVAGDFSEKNWLPYVGLLLTLGAGYRLAKFNIDTRQSNSFIGIPTPAMALFVLSIPLIISNSEFNLFVQFLQNRYFLIGITLLLTYLMNAEIYLFSLKFKTFNIKENAIKYLFLIVSLIGVLTLKFIAIPLIIILYVMVSLISNLKKNKVLFHL